MSWHQDLVCPHSVVSAYGNFLSGVRRDFRIGGQLFPPRTSLTGVPEGCPLAVLSMIIITWAVPRQVQACHDLPLRSCVDNWRIQASDPQLVCAATSTVSPVTENLGMSLSPDKSIAYATSTEFRGILRRFSVEGVFVPVANDFW